MEKLFTKKENSGKMKIIELFSGIGAFSQALKNLGIDYQHLFVSEINSYSEKIFNKLHGNVKNLGNIKEITLDKISKYKGGCDVLCLGSPCQDFSNAGANKGGTKNSKTRSSLIWEGVRIIENIKPKIVIFENVKNIKIRHKKTLREFKKSLHKVGYFYRSFVLNSLDFGIPQNRERLFVIATLNKKYITTYKRPKGKKLCTNLQEFLKIKTFKSKNILPFKPKYNFTNFVTWKDRKGNKNGSYNRAWKINKYCGTLSYSNKIKIAFDKKVRYITPLESWLLMGYSKENYKSAYSVVPNDNKLISVAGNSIVVSVLEAIFTGFG